MTKAPFRLRLPLAPEQADMPHVLLGQGLLGEDIALGMQIVDIYRVLVFEKKTGGRPASSAPHRSAPLPVLAIPYILYRTVFPPNDGAVSRTGTRGRSLNHSPPACSPSTPKRQQ